MGDGNGDYSGAVLHTRINALERNFNDHVEIATSRAFSQDKQMKELLESNHAQELALNTIVTGQKTAARLIKLMTALVTVAIGITTLVLTIAK